ncbi:MAG TPA: hypothetical protein VLA09_11130 [Longimicrobiales bacterium]|nr:hypothetical protein [Longimicrobiales bacterium]
MTRGTESDATQPDRATRALYLEVAAAFLLSLSAGFAYLLLDQKPLFFDEYYHLLAGRSWAESGTFAIADGSYERAGLLSAAVGLLVRAFGDSVLVPRMGAAVIAAGWCALLFYWIARQAGKMSAWVTAVLFALSPLVLINSVMIRFYGVAGLLVLCGVIAIFAVASREQASWKRAALFVLGILFIYLSYRTTRLTRVWVLGLWLWIGAMALAALARSVFRVPGLAILLMLAGILSTVAWTSGWIQLNWEVYTSAQLWAGPRASDLRWYERVLRADYPTLWSLLPLAGVLALHRAPRLAGLSLVVFIVGLGVLSGAAPKSERYLLPLLPYFFIVWGLAIPEAWRLLKPVGSELLDRVPALREIGPLKSTARILAWSLVLAFLLGANPGFLRLRSVMTGYLATNDAPPPGVGMSPGAWDQLAPVLRAAMGEVDVTVTANSLQTLYHVGDFDIDMMPTVVAELPAGREFSIDPRTGRPAIGTLESLQSLVDRHPSGLIFGENWRWGHLFEGFTSDVEDFVSSTMTEVELGPGSSVRAYRWERVPDG